jgi:hypothetical protein
MISCLFCASCILLVATKFAQLDQRERETGEQILDEDAETCLKGVEALGPNSDGARIARDMLQRLQDHRTPSGM